MDTLLLAWTSDAPMFTVIEPVEGRWTLGREHPAWPTPDERMSRRHCEVERTAKGWELCDLGSTNGSRLDGSSFASRIKRKDWHVLQLGHSLLVPCSSRVLRLDIAHPTFAARDWDDLEEASRPMVGRRGRVAVPWLMQHAARMTAPLTLDVSLVSAFLQHQWIDTKELLDTFRETVRQALATGASRVLTEHIPVEDELERGYHPLCGRVVEIGDKVRPPSPGQLNRLRDPEVFRSALRDSNGDHHRAAAYLKLSLEAFERWLRRHQLDAP